MVLVLSCFSAKQIFNHNAYLENQASLLHRPSNRMLHFRKMLLYYPDCGTECFSENSFSATWIESKNVTYKKKKLNSLLCRVFTKRHHWRETNMNWIDMENMFKWSFIPLRAYSTHSILDSSSLAERDDLQWDIPFLQTCAVLFQSLCELKFTLRLDWKQLFWKFSNQPWRRQKNTNTKLVKWQE